MAPVDMELPGAASQQAPIIIPKDLPEGDTDTLGASGGKAESEGTVSTPEDFDSNSGDDSESHGGFEGEVCGEDVPDCAAALLPKHADLPESVAALVPQQADLPEGAAALVPHQTDDVPDAATALVTQQVDLPEGAAAIVDQQAEQLNNNKTKEQHSLSDGNQSGDFVADKTIETKAESLAEFVILNLIGKNKSGKSNDKVERTLLRCVKTMMSKHELLFKGMMKRLNITQENGYMTFVSIANELFEGDKMAVNWGRIVALYSFGGQLALHCVESKMEDYALNIATFMGRYSSEVVAPFVRQSGGWNKLCEEYPEEEDLENKAWNFLTWTAVGLGIVSAVTFFTSH